MSGTDNLNQNDKNQVKKKQYEKTFIRLGIFYLRCFFFGNCKCPGKRTAKANAGLSLPSGFSASIVADNLGRARHLVVTPQGDIYVRLARPEMVRAHSYYMKQMGRQR